MIPEETISTWQRIEKRHGGVNVAERGRPRVKNLDYKEWYEILKKYLDALKEEDAKKK